MTTDRPPPPGMACLICGSDRLRFWASASDPEYATTTDRFDYFQCGACGGLSINPCPEAQLGEIYPPSYYSFSGETFSLLGTIKHAMDRRLFASVLADVPGRDLSAVDIGGGSGWLLSQAKLADPRLKRTVVVDIDDSAASVAREAGHEFVLSRVEDFQSAERFDLVVMLNLIEHVKYPTDLLAAAARLLSPQGVLVIKTPNCDSLDARLFRGSYWGGLHSPRHWALFTPQGFEQAAQRAGLTVSKLQLTQGAPFWACSILAWAVRQGWVDVTPERPMYRHPAFNPLLALSAGFDFLRRPFSSTSQMFGILRRSGHPAEIESTNH